MTKFTDIIKYLPSEPGIYKYFNENNEVIYVGKAKNIKKRVSSYFTTQNKDTKTRILLRHIFSIDYIVVDTEQDALLLENSLIKKYKPRYNILLKDDKSYPWLCIKKEPFPRVFITRKVEKNGSLYFGPYVSVSMLHNLYGFLKKSYSLRRCSYYLSSENIEKRKFKKCLQYHVKTCEAPCEGLQSASDYDSQVEDIKKILRGDIASVISHLKIQMSEASDKLMFEEAQRYKERIDQLRKYQSKSTVVSSSITNVDVYSIENDEKIAYVNFLRVIQGSIIQVYTVEIKKKFNEPSSTLLLHAILNLRERFLSDTSEVIVPFKLPISIEGIVFTVPKIGDKKKLLELSQRNASFYKLEKLKRQSERQSRVEKGLKEIESFLRLKNKPLHIECFDNSNLQGTHPVAACVVFKDGKPQKSLYRHFNVKSVVGSNDFASMEEIVYRRYNRQLLENSDLPDLVIIDGGKGQLSSALKALERLDLRGKVPIIGLAKKQEAIFLPEDKFPLFMDKKGEGLRIIRQARDEAHRFGITFHRSKRSEKNLQSSLQMIEGVGTKRSELLLKHFKSVNNIRQASIEELKKVVSSSLADRIVKYFKEVTD